jgi:ubiquinone/menaquinone biosynthesis C-methylase UbiE
MMDYQDMLAFLGLGNAHPGGYAATLDMLKTISLPNRCRILEVGCGTGRTACALAKMGHEVTAVDIRSNMIEKARKRASLEEVEVNWVIGDVHQLPFDADSYDALIVESVTVFVDSDRAMGEYYRVLKPGAKLYDREMMAIQLPPDLKERICKFYGVQKVPTADKWIEMASKAGFREVSIQSYISVAEEMLNRSFEEVDQYQFIDPDVYTNPEFIEMSITNTELMFDTMEHLAHGVITGMK